MPKKKATKRADGGSGKDPEPDFESSLTEVEQIVARLESGDLDLTESLQQYEIGIKRLKQCHTLLEAAEQRVSLLSGFDADGNPVRQPIQNDSKDPSADSAPSTPKRKRRRKTSAAQNEGSQIANQGSDSPPSSLEAEGNSVDDLPGLF